MIVEKDDEKTLNAGLYVAVGALVLVFSLIGRKIFQAFRHQTANSAIAARIKSRVEELEID